MADLNFPSAEAILALHHDLLAQYGGPAGHRAELVSSIAAYPRQKVAYPEAELSVPIIAGCLGFAAARFHAFADGNKRVAYALVLLFLGTNGYSLAATADDAYEAIIRLADGSLSEHAFGRWVEEHAIRR